MQVVVVVVIGLVMRIDPDDFDDETVSREVYGNVMVVLLLLTTVPAVSALMYRSPTERSLALLKQAANSEGGSHLATKRRELRKLRPETAEVHQETEDQLEGLQQQPELLEDSQQSQWGQEDEREREPHTELEPIPKPDLGPEPEEKHDSDPPSTVNLLPQTIA